MTTNGGGSDTNRVYDLGVYDRLPPEVRKELQDAPINLGAGSARHLLLRYDAKETASCTREFIDDYMHGGESESTLAKWGGGHPQADRGYPWRSYQLAPTRNLTRVVPIRANLPTWRNTR